MKQETLTLILNQSLIIILILFAAPILGGIYAGIDRIITARLQNRVGPPLFQPFYDVFKLLSKQSIVANKLQLVGVWAYFVSVVLCLALLLLKQDLLLIVFVLAGGSMFFILGGFSVKSPYSQMGSQREIMQMLAYEPILIFYVIAIYLKTGSFSVESIFQNMTDEPLLYSLPLFVIGLVIIFTIKLRKSPFDISTSHHAHQEIIKGITTEYSGQYLALIEVTHWYEYILLMGLAALLWTKNVVIGGVVIPGIVIGSMMSTVLFFTVTLIDNITARLTWSWMVRFAWTFGIGISLANLFIIYWAQLQR
jgi:ech hydrogenase subunit B